MKWRSVDEKPKINGMYICIDKVNANNENRVSVACFENGAWQSTMTYRVLTWLDPEVPEEFLRPKIAEKKPCPWCKQKNWIIKRRDHLDGYSYVCPTWDCIEYGPNRRTEQEAEAAIFERLK